MVRLVLDRYHIPYKKYVTGFYPRLPAGIAALRVPVPGIPIAVPVGVPVGIPAGAAGPAAVYVPVLLPV
jgi:hypothetical protein